MPKPNMSALNAALAAGAKPKKRKRGRSLEVDNQRVYQFRREGKMLRKTVYFSPAEWRAIEKAAAATADSATRVIREAVRAHLRV